MNNLEKLVDSVNLKFKSGNSVPVDRATLSASEWDEISLALAIFNNIRKVRGEWKGLYMNDTNTFIGIMEEINKYEESLNER